MKNIFYCDVMKVKKVKSQAGFILLVALIAIAILSALGILVFSLSTGDLKTSVSTYGEKKALGSLESGYHVLTQNFDAVNIPTYGVNANIWTDVDAGRDPGSQYKVTNITLSSFAPLPPPGYSMEQSQGYGMARYDLTVLGQSTTYNTNVQVDLGVGFGPVSLSLIYK